jgi:hypothetical protein
MNRLKTPAAALAALLIGGTAAQAACPLTAVSNKSWALSVTDSGPNRYMLYCGFKTSAAGTFGLTPNACAGYKAGAITNFTTPANLDLVSGNMVAVPGKACGFDLTLTFVGGATITARLLMASGKSTASGSWVSTFSGYGPATLARQPQ